MFRQTVNDNDVLMAWYIHQILNDIQSSLAYAIQWTNPINDIIKKTKIFIIVCLSFLINDNQTPIQFYFFLNKFVLNYHFTVKFEKLVPWLSNRVH